MKHDWSKWIVGAVLGVVFCIIFGLTGDYLLIPVMAALTVAGIMGQQFLLRYLDRRDQRKRQRDKALRERHDEVTQWHNDLTEQELRRQRHSG